MASYQERNKQSIKQYGKSLYERRIEKATGSGLSKAQARGHARASKGEKPISVIQPRTVKPKPEPIYKRVEKFSTPERKMRVDRLVRTYSTNFIEQQLRKEARNNPKNRVYFNVFNSHSGVYTPVYKGNRGKPHGISIGELLDRVEARQRNARESGEELSFDEAFREQMSGDSSGYGGTDSPGDEDVPEDFTQIDMYVMNTGNFNF